MRSRLCSTRRYRVSHVLACVQAAAGLLGRAMAGSVVSPTGPRTADSWAAEEVLALAASLKTTNRAMVASVTEAARSVPTAADADAETPVLSAADIPWGEPVASTRDRSLGARLEYAIATGSDGLEHADPHLASVKSWINDHPAGCDAWFSYACGGRPLV